MQSERSRKKRIHIDGLKGLCGGQPVFMGFAPASLLHTLSFADVLNEHTGTGYQRPISKSHSLGFRKYIQTAGATTIPLTFNLRPAASEKWTLTGGIGNQATLQIAAESGPILAQVDCQHRLGFLKDVAVPLAFMTFIGLSVREEMEVFNVINSKAKGLSSSLLDYHESKLSADLSAIRPEIYIALKLNERDDSPWYRKLDLGGSKTVGMQRYASLRTMQKAVKRFLKQSAILRHHPPDYAFNVVLSFWVAITQILSREWNAPRTNLLTKGVGVYSLMSIAGELHAEAAVRKIDCDVDYFVGVLSDFVRDVDWSNSGPMKGFGGAAGADQALELIRQARRKKRLKVISNGE